jgi:exosortase
MKKACERMKKTQSDTNRLNKDKLLLGLKIGIPTIIVLALYFQDLILVANAAIQNEFIYYILAVPFLFIYLLYRKRKMLRATIGQRQNEKRLTRYLPTITGILLSATAIFIYWYGSNTSATLQYHIMTLPVFAAGLTLIFFNTQTLRESIFAITLLLFLTPPPTFFSDLSSIMSVTTSKISYSLLKVFQIPATLTTQSNPVLQITNVRGSTISLPIDSAFSGIYILIGFIAFGLVTAYILRDKLWKRLTLFAVGLALVYIINIAMITRVLTIGYQIGGQAAFTVFHQLGGLIVILLGTLLCLIIAERALHTRIFSKPAQICRTCVPPIDENHSFCLSCGRVLKLPTIRFSKSDIAKTIAIAAITILLISIQTPALALTREPPQIPTGNNGDTQLLPQISNYELQFLYHDTNFENTSGQDAALIYLYTPSEETRNPVYVDIQIASTASQLRPWEYSSLGPGGSAGATQLEQKDIQIQDNPSVTAKYFAFNLTKTNQTQTILYWSQTAVFMINNTPQQKELGISIIEFPTNPQNPANEAEMQPIATAIAQYWKFEPVEAWTQIGLLLSQQSLIPAAATITALLAIGVIYASRRRNQRKANASVYSKLSEQTKNIIEAISETEKTAPPTLNAIKKTYKTRTGETTDEEMLMRLKETEKTGIVKSEIANVRDEPKQIWKT